MQNDRNRSLPGKAGYISVPVAAVKPSRHTEETPLEVAYKHEKAKVHANWMRAAILLFIFSKILVITIVWNNWKVKRLEQDVTYLKNEIKQIKSQQAVLATAHD